MTSAVVGIDVSKAHLDVYGRAHRDHAGVHVRVSNTPDGMVELVTWLNEHALSQAHVAMEATGRYYELVAVTLVTEGYLVSVVNPAQIKAYGESRMRRNKTDRLDAVLIADFCAAQRPDAWQPLTKAQRDLQDLVRYRDALLEQRHQEHNRLQALVGDSPLIPLLRQAIALIDTQLKAVETQIRSLIRTAPELQQTAHLLVSIPGIAEKTAWQFMAEVPDIRRFRSAKELVAYAGLNPAHNQSGKRTGGYTPISKKGNSRLRRALYMPGIVAKQHNPLIRPLTERMIANGKAPKEAVVAAMRKLLHLAYGVLKHQQPFDPNYLNRQEVALAA